MRAKSNQLLDVIVIVQCSLQIFVEILFDIARKQEKTMLPRQTRIPYERVDRNNVIFSFLEPKLPKQFSSRVIIRLRTASTDAKE